MLGRPFQKQRRIGTSGTAMDDGFELFAGLRAIKRYYPGLERLVCRALAEPEFTARLLADPQATLTEPLEDLALSEVERTIGGAIKDAPNLAAYAASLHAEVLRRRASASPEE